MSQTVIDQIKTKIDEYQASVLVDDGTWMNGKDPATVVLNVIGEEIRLSPEEAVEIADRLIRAAGVARVMNA